MASAKKEPESAVSTAEASAPAEPAKLAAAKVVASKPEAKAEAVILPPPPAPAPAPAPAAPSGPQTLLYRVWPHGVFKRNGKRYAPGDTLELREDEAASIACLSRVTSD